MTANPSPKTILVVEDEAALQEVLLEVLTSEGYKVLQGKNGQEGLALALKHHPDLIILDIIMPRMDGMKLLQQLRKDAWGKGVQVMVLTNVSDTKSVYDAMSYLVDTYFIKSDMDLEDLAQKVKTQLAKK